MKRFKLERDIPVEEGFDIAVLGGGPAGTAAAVCAARLGAKVLLVEATGCLGGMGTSGLVTAFAPLANGEKMLAGGFMRELVEKMFERGFIPDNITPDHWRKKYLVWTPFNPEGLKLLLDEFVEQAGVQVRFFTHVVDSNVLSDSNHVDGVIINNIEGYSYIRAKTFIDATGDATLAHLSGVPCREAGRDTPNIMPPTLCSLFTGIEWDRIKMGSWALTDEQKTIPERQQEILERAIADGHFSEPDYHFPGMMRIGRIIGNLNAPHIYNMNALLIESLTKGMMLGRRLTQEYKEFYRKYMPGFENIEHVTTATLMGVRESRRIVGEYEINHKDYLNRRQFPDQICVINRIVDIHPYDGTKEALQRHREEESAENRLGPGECVGIPYSILVPKGWENLWVPGRSVSCDIKMHGVVRCQPAASLMGQAAGTAAVQSIDTGQAANNLDTAQLVKTLRNEGAYLPQGELSTEMTRF